MKKIIIIAIVVFLLILGGSAYYFVGTPSYSLYKLKSAITQHDSATFNKYVDIDRVVSNLMDQASSGDNNGNNSTDGQNSNWGAELFKSLLPAIKQQMKDAINSSIEDISKGKNDKISTLKIKNISQEGKSAKVTLVNSNGDELALDMIQSPQRYWIIVGVNENNFSKINPFNTNTNTNTSSVDSSNSSSGAASSMGTADSSGTTKKMSSTAKFGDKTAIAQNGYITVNQPEDYTAPKNSFNQPASGNKFVTVEVEYSNETSDEDSVTPSNLKLKDDEDHSYDSDLYAIRKPSIEDGAILPAHERIKGYVTFEVPENAQIVKAVYSNDTATVVFE